MAAKKKPEPVTDEIRDKHWTRHAKGEISYQEYLDLTASEAGPES